MSQIASNSQSVVLGTVGGVLAIGAITVISIVSVVIMVVVHMRRNQKSIPVEKGRSSCVSLWVVLLVYCFTAVPYLTNFLNCTL